MLQKSLAALALCFGLIACATPESVPSGANVWYDPTTYSGRNYTWRRTVEHGCAALSASDGAPIVRLVVDPARCRGSIRTHDNCDECGPGFLYYGDNYAFFQNYWPWTSDDMMNGMIFDSNGMWIGVRPCPHALTPEQLATLRLVASEVLAEAATDAERQTMERVSRLLAATNGADLVSAQHGCSVSVATNEG